MSKILLFLISFSFIGALLPTSGKLPPLPPKKPEIEKLIWVNYSRKVAGELFPAHPKLLNKTIFIAKDKKPYAIGYQDRIEISTGMIREVKNENQYGAMLGHELGHKFLQHNPQKNLQGEVRELLIHPDFKRFRLYETEADFVSIATTGNLQSAYDLLSHYLSLSKGKINPLLKHEIEKENSLRLQVMRNMLKVNRFAPIVSANPLPKPLPNWESGGDIWDEYSHKVLLAMYPNYKEELRRLIVIISSDGDLATGGRFQNNKLGKITLNLNWLSEVIQTPEEFAVLIGHEFGHVIVYRDYDLDYLDTGVSYNDQEVEYRRQFEADTIAVLPIVNGECIWANTLERISNSVAKHMEQSKYDLDADLDRIAHLRDMCSGE